MVTMDLMRREEIFAVNCLKLIQQYSWLLNAFILDFYTENHWEKLPLLWRETLCQTSLEEVGEWMLMCGRNPQRVWPLSLLALRASAKAYSLPRKHVVNPLIRERSFSNRNSSLKSSFGMEAKQRPGMETECLTNENLKNLFMRHVKPKKRHETVIMAKLCANAAKQSGVHCVVDVGGGKGHLSRLLAYGYGLNVCCVESQVNLIASGRDIDRQIEYTASKYLGSSYVQNLPKPDYVEMTVAQSTEALQQFMNIILNKFKKNFEDNVTFGIVGLHPCGDLAAILLNIFSNFKETRFISIASCCYMKLSLNQCDLQCCYPLSNSFKSLPQDLTNLTYEALEVSCHALEAYCQRLQNHDYNVLKIHCYRAVLEKLIVKYYPDMRHTGLRGVKHFDEMDFASYAKIAMEKVDMIIPISDLLSEETLNHLDRWQQVVVFYSLRLLLAPLVETAVLLDRILFINEQGGVGFVIPGFDPILSPRNLIIQGLK